MAAAVVSAAPSEAAEVPLPVRRTPVARTDPLALLGPSRPGESVSLAPGPVDDAEVVRVGLAPDGSVASVVVEQVLTINGVGDFEVRVLGPVDEVDAPPEQSPQPGLRRNTMTWSGFSPGRKVLRSTMVMQPGFEATRLPLAVSVAPDGAVTLRNQTTLPTTIGVGAADPGALRALVASVRSSLAAGRAPLAGSDGLPSALPARDPVGTERVYVTVPLRVVGTVGSTPVDVVVADTPVVVAGAVVGGAGGGGEVRLRVEGTLPPAESLSPDAGLREVQIVLAQTARLVDVQVFVGVTFDGPSTAVYEYAPAPPPPPAPPPVPDPEADLVTVALSAVAALALAAVARAVWQRA